MASHPLIERFARARLPLDLATAPLGRGAGLESIVQLDIRRARPRSERFVLWHGDPRNRVEVEGMDRDERQLVLMVHERRHRFEVELNRWATFDPTRVTRRAGHRRWISEVTAERKRHFLLGMDEAHLFIARLPAAVSTVRAAREALKGRAVRAAEASASTDALRQGEWFFLPVSALELGQLDVIAQAADAPISRHRGIAQAARWNRAGREHLADEILVLETSRPTPQGVFVRGRVRHPDHATIELRTWHRVYGNEELSDRSPGMTWID